MSRSCLRTTLELAALVLAPLACEPAPDVASTGTAGDAAAAHRELASFGATLAQAIAMADSIERVLLPVPLLTPAEEASLRQSSNAEQLARARELGIRAADSTGVRRALEAGRLVELEDSTSFWVVRELRSSLPYVTPGTRHLLQHIGRRFQERLAEMGLPAYRVEITSALRTAADQAQLRESNVNAAAGASTHEYGTTVDLAYEGYAAPAALDLPLPDDPDAARLARTAAALALERVAARKSRELQKVLGLVLREMQREGLLLVTLERQQPVFHLTVARATPP